MRTCGAVDRCRKDTVINKDKQALDDYVMLSGDTLEPPNMRLDGLVDDDVTPCFTLEVEKLTSTNEGSRQAEPGPRPGHPRGEHERMPDASLATTMAGAEDREDYGRALSLWSTIREYLGL